MSQDQNVLTPRKPDISLIIHPRQTSAITFPENSEFTRQEFADECNVNVIMSRYLSTGELPNLNDSPQYLDVTQYDYSEMQNFIAGAKSMFHSLPSTVRNQFDNDPSLFLDFCSQEKNRPELKEMGLLKPEDEWVKVPVAPAPAPVSVPPAPAPAPAPAE